MHEPVANGYCRLFCCLCTSTTLRQDELNQLFDEFEKLLPAPEFAEQVVSVAERLAVGKQVCVNRA